MPHMQQRRVMNLALQIGIVFLVYTAIALLATWPLLAHISTHITDHFGDGALHMWNTWWVGEALAKGQSPYYTDRIFFPYGSSLVTQNFAWFHILPSLFFELFLNDVAAFNVAILLNLTLCGVVVFWVARALCRDARAAFIAGLIYMLWPYRVVRLDLPNTLATYWIPPFLLFLIYSIERRQARYALLAGLFLALTGYARWQFLVPAGIMGLVIALFYLAAQPAEQRRAALGQLFLAALSASVLLLPPAAMLWQAQATWSDITHEGDEEVLMSADLLAYVTPSQEHVLFGDQTEALHDRYYFDRESLRRRPAYLGLVPLLLAILGIYYFRRRALPWAVLALVMMLLSLGPVMRVNGQLLSRIPTPYSVLSPLGILELMRNPERFVIFVALPLAMLAAYGLTGLLGAYVTRPAVGWLIAAALGLVIFFEYFSPQVVLRDRASQPALFADLAVEREDFAVLNLPYDVLKARAYMGDQIVHQKAIVQGNLSRIPPSASRYTDENPWLRTLASSGEMAPEFPDISRQLGILSADNIRYLILHKDLVGADRIAHWQRALMIAPRYEDDQLVAYSTAPRIGQDAALAAAWAPGPAPVSMLLSADCVHPGHPLVVSIGWGSETALDKDLAVRLALVGGDDTVQAGDIFPLVAGWPSSTWPADTLAWGHYQLDLPRSVIAGDYELAATLLDSRTGEEDGQTKRLAPIRVQETVCNRATKEQAIHANALFGDELRLVEYEIAQEDRRLKLDLNWQAERFLDSEYTVFVHVFDLATDVPVAQDDGRPRDGAYAMRHWWPGEIVDDRVIIDLSMVPAGDYGIAVGLYDPASSARLPVVDQQGEPLVDDGRFVLPQGVTIP